MVPLEHVEDRPAGHIDDPGDEPSATASRRRLHHGLIEADHRDRADPAGVIDTHLCDGSTPAHTVDHVTPNWRAIDAGVPSTASTRSVAPRCAACDSDWRGDTSWPARTEGRRVGQDGVSP